YTLEVKLHTPTPWFPQMVSLSVLVALPQETIEKYGESWTNPEHLVSSGPFVLETYRLNDTMDFKKNEKHFDAKNTVLTKVHFDFINNPNTNYYKYLTGEYAITNIPVQFKRTVLNERPEEVVTLRNLGTYWLKFNTQKVTDPRVRTALGLLVNREVFTKQILGNHVPTAQVPPPNVLDAEKVQQAPWLKAPQSENNKRAVELLTQAGYSKDKPLVITLLQTSGGNSGKYFVAMQGWYKQGTNGLVELKQEAVEARTVMQKVANGEYEFTISGWIADYNQVTTFYNTFLCNSPLNEYRYCNPEFDKLVEQANNENDVEKRRELYAKANDVLMTDMPVAPLFNTESLVLKSPALGGYNPNAQQRYVNDYFFIEGQKAKGVK
ncbi:peptide ABC transporter substrate-binding protein, partial [Psittacicella gerlachiana]